MAYGSGIYRSVDGGRHWSHALPGHSITSVAAGSSGTLYTAAGDGLYVTHDGVHWTLVSAIGNQPVVQVVASGPTAYAAIPFGMLKTIDGGRSWKTLSHAPQGIEFLGLAPSSPNEIFAEVAQKGFVASHDGGITWQPANNGIHDRNFSASTIRVAPSAPNVVYTGSWGVHFYASRDAGRHWKQIASLIQ